MSVKLMKLFQINVIPRSVVQFKHVKNRKKFGHHYGIVIRRYKRNQQKKGFIEMVEIVPLNWNKGKELKLPIIRGYDWQAKDINNIRYADVREKVSIPLNRVIPIKSLIFESDCKSVLISKKDYNKIIDCFHKSTSFYKKLLSIFF